LSKGEEKKGLVSLAEALVKEGSKTGEGRTGKARPGTKKSDKDQAQNSEDREAF